MAIDQSLTMGGIGGASFLVSAVASFISNSAKNKHEQFLASLNAASQAYKYRIQDVQNARKQPFPFARRLILFSVFILISILLFLIAFNNLQVTIPYIQNHEYLYGLIKSQGYAFKTVNGFVFMMQPFADCMAMISGFYFGSTFKN